MKTLIQSLEYHQIMGKYSTENKTYHQSMANIYTATLHNIPAWMIEHDKRTVAEHR